MIYRVVIKISYKKAIYDFDNIQSAGQFAEMALIHSKPNEDKEEHYITIKVINPDVEEAEDEE